MYSIVFTSILFIILFFRIIKLSKNKHTSGNFEDLDDELVIMLNEGDNNG